MSLGNLFRFVYRTVKTVVLLVVGALVVVLVAGGIGYARSRDTPPAGPAEIEQATEGLGVEIAEEDCGPDGYDRDRQYPGGFDENVRRLLRSTDTDYWTGTALRPEPKPPEIDHIVPVRDFHCSGGWRLDQAGRAAFYNDTRNLELTASSINQAKSDKTPGEWRPPTPEKECQFLGRWLGVKRAYQLTIDPVELARINQLLPRCTEQAPA